MTSCDLFSSTQLSRMTTTILGIAYLHSSIILNLLEWYVNRKLHNAFASASLRSLVIKKHFDIVPGQVSKNKIQNHDIGVKIIDRWPRMPIMKHGKATTKILNLNLNRGCYSRGSHVHVTSIISTVVIVTIKDDNTGNKLIRSVVATPLWPSVGVKPNTPKVGDLESSGTPECLEFDSKAQNTSHCDVIGFIGKVLKRRYRKWPRIGHLDICSSSYGQKKGQMTPDH
jgi:hypothetical protein